jgi:regulatory protein SWI6
MEVNNIAVMRRRKDSWLNATQILKVAGIEKGKRTKVLEKEILIGEHEKVQGGYGKYQGTWIKFDRGLEFCRQYGVEDLLRPLLTYDMGQDGGVAGRGGIDTPTKEQAMAAQRKRLYNSGAENRSGNQSGTFFKNISSTASHAVAAISKARFDSPAPRNRNGANSGRPASFSRQSSQQNLASQDNAYPSGSQQSMQSFVSNDGLDSAYATQYNLPRDDSRNVDFEEPPRKRMRPTPGETGSQQMNEYYDASMREPSPTEANESFAYQAQMIHDGENGILPPLSNSSNQDIEEKKGMLLSLFADPLRTDFSKHPVFLNMSREDLDTPIDKSSNTALIWAATLARIPLLKALINAGASIYRGNRVGVTALMRSCEVTNNLDMGSFPDVLELLGPTIELQDARFRTVLHHIAVASAVKGRSSASKYYLESLLEFVVRAGTAPNSQQSQSFSSNPIPAHTMNLGRFMSEVVNLQDKAGDTALNIAARIGNRNIISQLLEVGANLDIRNRSGLCPSDFGIGENSGNNDSQPSRIPPPERMPSRTNQTSNEIISCKYILFFA